MRIYMGEETKVKFVTRLILKIPLEDGEKEKDLKTIMDTFAKSLRKMKSVFPFVFCALER